MWDNLTTPTFHNSCDSTKDVRGVFTLRLALEQQPFQYVPGFACGTGNRHLA